VTDLLVERHDGVQVLTLNRPASANALDPRLLSDLDAAFTRIDEDDGVRAVILTGAGERHFCAGMDLAAFSAPASEVAADAQESPPSRSPLAMFQAPCAKPIIAAVNGTARMGGIELALACDLIVASSAARLGDGHPGGIGGGGVAKRLPEAIGARAARWLMYTGDLVDAERAYQLGLVQQVYPAERFDADVIALAQRIAGRRMGNSLARIKALTRPERPGLTELHDEIDQSIRQYFDPDVLAGFAEWQAAELP
jgi:enoyl-CoA hydratase/carnithine racemase